MRKITMLNRISVDGFFATLNEKTWGMDWFVPDPEVDKAVHGGGPNDTLILGRVTFEGFERSWVPHLTNADSPKELKAVAEELTQMNKVVFSTKLKEATWKNTTLLHGDLPDEVRKLKQSTGTGILILGSGTIVQQLADAGLIDDYLFILSPVIAGSGKPLFPDVRMNRLKLVDARAFKSGNVVVHYQVESEQ